MEVPWWRRRREWGEAAGWCKASWVAVGTLRVIDSAGLRQLKRSLIHYYTRTSLFTRTSTHPHNSTFNIHTTSQLSLFMGGRAWGFQIVELTSPNVAIKQPSGKGNDLQSTSIQKQY